jgi:hypothetical protein
MPLFRSIILPGIEFGTLPDRKATFFIDGFQQCEAAAVSIRLQNGI